MSSPKADRPTRDFVQVMDMVLDGIAAICRFLTGVSLVVLTVISAGWCLAAT